MLKLHSAHAQKNGERLIPALRIRITFAVIRRAALRIASAINKMEASGSGPAKRKVESVKQPVAYISRTEKFSACHRLHRLDTSITQVKWGCHCALNDSLDVTVNVTKPIQHPG